ncbi:hypothetical protein PISL3812_08380 [Talaromyces islandicus]|uniref:Fungal specific transcription factor n=1 Tax=Talaromyces islandicus TaxID=28573 RepID=A0A0U1M7J4_TALIS|nr:hypothetical protein PISL3812_08380 [Talaromyces islandicus]
MPKETPLHASRWAIPSSTTTDPSGDPSPSQELARFMKIVARLKWKLPFLSEAYRLATTHAADVAPDDVAYAEIMFKIDFHEYYALLERAIVHLLAVFGVSVDSQFQKSHVLRNGSHRYHANVLEALRKRTCPLYPVLGKGLAQDQLRLAKQLRNQWKTADSTEDERQRLEQDSWSLESYDLEVMLNAIFGGLEEGYALAQASVPAKTGQMDVDSNEKVVDTSPWNTETGWDFIVDAMDWEAV